MPFYRDDTIGTQYNALQDFTPTPGMSLKASVGEAWQNNPTVLGYDAFQKSWANQGEKLTGYDAAGIAKAAGFPEMAPNDGEYTRPALDMILERKRQDAVRQDVMNRTPYSWTGTPVRAAATLATTLMDPLNVASAFVPVIAPARYTALLSEAGTAGARALLRAQVGMLEGAAGMAVLEPGIYGAHKYLNDDYSMGDSMLNIALGGVLGGGLHVVGGKVGDWANPSKWVKARTVEEAAAMPHSGVEQSRQHADMPTSGAEIRAADVAAAALPEQRKAALDSAVSAAAEGRTVNVNPVFGYHGTRAVFGDFGATNDFGFHFAASDAPHIAEGFAIRDAGTDGRVISAALNVKNALELPDLAGWFPTNVADAMVERGAAPADFNARVWEKMQAAEAAVWEKAPPAVQEARVPGKTNADTSKWADAARDASNKAGYDEIKAELTRRGYDAVSYMNTIDANQPGRSYIVWDNQKIRQLASGEPLTPEAMRAAAEHAASPQANALADFPASRAADERIAAAPKSPELAAAEQSMADAEKRMADLTANLKAGGMDEAKLAKIDEALKPFDEQLKTADAYGKAVTAAAICGMRS